MKGNIYELMTMYLDPLSILTSEGKVVELYESVDNEGFER